MTKIDQQKFGAELKIIRNKIVYPVLSSVIVLLIVAIVGYFGFIGKNKDDIHDLQIQKVDQQNFNKYLSVQQKINTLAEERQLMLMQRVEQIEVDIKRIEEINVEIARLQEQIKILLSDYTMRTRDGGEITCSIDLFIKEC